METWFWVLIGIQILILLVFIRLAFIGMRYEKEIKRDWEKVLGKKKCAKN